MRYIIESILLISYIKACLFLTSLKNNGQSFYSIKTCREKKIVKRLSNLKRVLHSLEPGHPILFQHPFRGKVFIGYKKDLYAPWHMRKQRNEVSFIDTP